MQVPYRNADLADTSRSRCGREPIRGIRTGAADDLSDHRGDFDFADDDKLEGVDQRVAFGPFEIHVPLQTGAVLDFQQDRGGRAGNGCGSTLRNERSPVRRR
ncbi:hypothetical protein [Nocardia sp. NPDC049526]|uniref:hypothetical protein n=1 Tax=Nocardia sp. NPDC049526 TaxID=3364316 RepID=UPI0037B1088F